MRTEVHYVGLCNLREEGLWVFRLDEGIWLALEVLAEVIEGVVQALCDGLVFKFSTCLVVMLASDRSQTTLGL